MCVWERKRKQERAVWEREDEEGEESVYACMWEREKAKKENKIRAEWLACIPRLFNFLFLPDASHNFYKSSKSLYLHLFLFLSLYHSLYALCYFHIVDLHFFWCGLTSSTLCVHNEINAGLHFLSLLYVAPLSSYSFPEKWLAVLVAQKMIAPPRIRRVFVYRPPISKRCFLPFSKNIMQDGESDDGLRRRD